MCTRNTLPRKKQAQRRVETTAVVQGATVETWEYDDENYVLVFGQEVSADVQRRETHSSIDSGEPRSACRFRYASELTTRGAAPPLSPIAGSSIELRGYKKAHWEEHDSLTDQMRSGTYWVQANWPVTFEGKSSVNMVDGGSFTDHNSARGWSYVINRRGKISDRLHRGRQEIEGVRVR